MNFEHLMVNPNNSLELAKDYIKRVLEQDNHLRKNFAQVLRYLKGLKVQKNSLRLGTGDKAPDPLEMTLPDRLGVNQRAEIIKVLRHYNFSYELRLDDAHKHYRIIFFVHQIDKEVMAFSFGFTKDGSSISNMTNLAAEETDRVCIQVLNGKKEEWLC